MDDFSVQRRQMVIRSVSAILTHLRSFPVDFRPAVDKEIIWNPRDAAKQRSAIDQIMRRHLSEWPGNVMSQFMHLSFLIGNECALARDDYKHLDGTYLKRPRSTRGDMGIDFATLFGLGSMRSVMHADPNFRAQRRYKERYLSAYVPYENMIYTFLGGAAFEYFNMASKEGRQKIQPHEASRENWIELYRIDSQVRIDLELQAMSELEPNQAKDVVVACWAIAGIMTHLSPSVFVNESEPYVSSVRSDGYTTISTGTGTRVLLSFRPGSLVSVLEFLLQFVSDDIFDAADLMWIALSLADVDAVAVPYGLARMSDLPSFDLFLSHRGFDAKHNLLRHLLETDTSGGVFLDCLAPSSRAVNRFFVYQSLVRSKAVFVIETKNFDSSPWCQKERALARYLNATRRLYYRAFPSVALACTAIEELHAQGTSKPRMATSKERNHPIPGPSDEFRGIELRKQGEHWQIFWANPPKTGLAMGPLWFILNDLENPYRTPNRKTLTHASAFLAQVDKELKLLDEAWRKGTPDPTELANSILQIIESLFEVASEIGSMRTARNAIGDDFFEVPLDVLTVLGQICFGLLSLGSTTMNKMEARRAADTIAALTREFVELVGAGPEPALNAWREYYSAMTVAVALEFDREATAEMPIRIGPSVCGGSVMIRDRQLLVDVRDRNDLSRFRLRFIAQLVRHGIGTAAIVQSARNPVHNASIDDFKLNVLPCVTLYPGMAVRMGLGEDRE